MELTSYPQYEDLTRTNNLGYNEPIDGHLPLDILRKISNMERVKERVLKIYPDRDESNGIYQFFYDSLRSFMYKIIDKETYRSLLKSRPQVHDFIDSYTFTVSLRRNSEECFLKNMKEMDDTIVRIEELNRWHENIMIPYIRSLIYPKVREFETNEGIEFTPDYRVIIRHINQNAKSKDDAYNLMSEYLGMLETLSHITFYKSQVKIYNSRINEIKKFRKECINKYKHFSPFCWEKNSMIMNYKLN